MPTTTTAAPTSKALWAGRVLSALPALLLVVSALMKLTRQAPVLESWTARFGYPEGTLLAIGLVELACAILYLIPSTAVLGAVLVTGYLGGAVATHVRVSDMFLPPAILGVLAWGGLWFRDPRVRALLPLRR
jgi:hypothetical protein